MPLAAPAHDWLIWPPLPATLAEATTRAAATLRFSIPPSHRGAIGPAVTAAKRSAITALGPALRALLASQVRFNAALVFALRALATDRAAGTAAARALGEAQAAAERTGLAARFSFPESHAWNLAAVQALALAADPSASPEQAVLAHQRLAAARGSSVSSPLRWLRTEALRPQRDFEASAERALHALLGLHTQTFSFRGYDIPVHLAELTGAVTQSWEQIARMHLAAYQRCCPIAKDQRVLEVGCGIGRDAMHLTEVLDRRGSYLGLDITRPSIDWCTRNVTAREPNFQFLHLDARSPLYNPGGSMEPEQVVLPVADRSVDRILLQSVFTHMLPAAVARYLAEFARVLRPGGLAYISLFHLDDEAQESAGATAAGPKLRHRVAEGCFVADPADVEAAVGYTPAVWDSLVLRAGLAAAQPIQRGRWSGLAGPDFQDAAVLRPA